MQLKVEAKVVCWNHCPVSFRICLISCRLRQGGHRFLEPQSSPRLLSFSIRPLHWYSYLAPWFSALLWFIETFSLSLLPKSENWRGQASLEAQESLLDLEGTLMISSLSTRWRVSSSLRLERDFLSHRVSMDSAAFCWALRTSSCLTFCASVPHSIGQKIITVPHKLCKARPKEYM